VRHNSNVIALQMKEKPKIVLSVDTKRGKSMLFLAFRYNRQLIENAKKIGCYWSISKNRWYINYSEKNLKTIYKTFKDIAEIDSTKIDKATLKENRYKIIKEIPEEYVNFLIRRRYSENTIKVYSSLFKEFVNFYADIEPDEITEDDIRKYQDYLVKKRKISISTQNLAINAIKFYYEKVLGREKGDYYIERPRRENRLPEIISESELLKLLKATENIKHKTIITMLYSSGVRRGELLNLRIQDLDFEKKIIFVRGGKGKKDRTTILADYAILVLKKYLEMYKPNYWLFEGTSRKQYSPTSVLSILRRSSLKAGLNKIVRPHMLRHSFATHMLEQGVDIRFIQTILGHESTKTTEIYTHVSKYSLAKIKSPFDAIFDK